MDFKSRAPGENTRSSTQVIRPVLARYGLALVMMSIALGIDLLLKTFLNLTSPGLYTIAAIVATWYGGFGPGLVVVLLTGLCNTIFFRHPHFSLAIGVYGIERLAVFTMASLLICWLTVRRREAESALRKLNAELERRVAIRTAALEESNRHLQSFCYTLAHDLRGPLRAMQGFSHFLLESNGPRMDEEGRDYARRICASSERMGQLLVDLLAYTELVRAELRIEPVSQSALVSETVRAYGGELASSGGKITVEKPLPLVRGDAGVLVRVWANLLSNAIKFHRPNVPPRVRIRAEERKGGNVRFWVEDNGVGIDPRYKERIFGVFEKLDVSGMPCGTGIGLAMVKQGVERMGGRVGVESSPGEGSGFWFELPEVKEVLGRN